jgi:hypothetical protein
VAVLLGIGWVTVNIARARSLGDNLWIYGLGRPLNVAEGTDGRGAFSVFNPTFNVVQVTVETGCGCENVSPQRFVLMPLSSEKVSYTVDLKNAVQGQHTKGLSLLCAASSNAWNEPLALQFRVLRASGGNKNEKTH